MIACFAWVTVIGWILCIPVTVTKIRRNVFHVVQAISHSWAHTTPFTSSDCDSVKIATCFLFSVITTVTISWMTTAWIYPISLGLVMAMLLRREFKYFNEDFKEWGFFVAFILSHRIVVYRSISYRIVAYRIVSYHIIMIHIISYHIRICRILDMDLYNKLMNH